MKISKNLSLVVSSFGMATLSWGIITPIMPIYITSIGIKPEMLGILFAVSWGGQIIGEIAGGWMADTRGFKLPIIVGTNGCIPIMLSLVVTQSFSWLLPVFFIWGLVRATIFGPTRGFIGNYASASNKVTLMALYNICFGLASSVGSFITGFVADNLGYHWDFFLAAGIFMAGGIAVCFFDSSTSVPRPAEIITIAKHPESGHPATLKSGIFIIQCAVAALFFLGMGIEMTFLPLLCTQIMGVTVTEVGILITIGGVISTILLVPIGRWADARGVKWFILGGLAVFAVSLFGFAIAETYAWLIATFIVLSIGRVMFSPAASALLSNTLPSHIQSTALGIYGASEDLGLLIGSIIGGFTWGMEKGSQLTFVTGGGAIIVAVILAVLLFLPGRQPGEKLRG
jgi:MFS family permease